jgi:hypothetical protein
MGTKGQVQAYKQIKINKKKNQITYLNVFSISSGIILDRSGLSVSKQELVLTSIRLNLKFSSSIKS